MTFEEWSFLIKIVTAAVLALGPWMFMVHAKLAVLADRMKMVSRKLDKLAESGEQMAAVCVRHDARLEMNAEQIDHLHRRLGELE